MLKLFKRSSKLKDAGDCGPPVLARPTDLPELLVSYIGTGKPDESVDKILDGSNVGIPCRVAIREQCLIVTELTDVVVLRIAGGHVKECRLHDTVHGKLSNCVSVIVRQEAEGSVSLCHLFETGSIKEAEELAGWIRSLIRTSHIENSIVAEPVVLSASALISADRVMSGTKSSTTAKSRGLLTKVNKIGRKPVSRSKPVSIKTRHQKIEAVANSVGVLVKDNNRLHLVCCNAPVRKQSDPFWAALQSLCSHDCSQLMECMKRPGLNTESCDPEGNTLLHYATVLGRKDMIKALHKSGANLDSACWRMFRPLHRAVANGDVSVIQTLLALGAAPNGVDINGRSALHVSASSAHYLECIRILVEHGAKIRLADCNGIRPIDLREDLWIIQNQIITSACERFADAPLKSSRSATLCSSDSSAMPNALSASSAPDPITMVTTGDGQAVNDMLDHVVSFAANTALSADLKLAHSKSVSNLHDLEECEDNKKMLSQKLKYPSSYSLNVTGIVEESANDVEMALKNLIDAASKVNTSQHLSPASRPVATIDTLFGTHTLIQPATSPVTSEVSLHTVSSSTLLNSAGNSSNSRGTRDVASIQDSSSTHMLHRAFSNLERQLHNERNESLKDKKSAIAIKKDLSKDYIGTFRNSIGLPTVHNIPTRSKKETDCLFEEILQDLNDKQDHNKQSSEGDFETSVGHQHQCLSLGPSVVLATDKSAVSHASYDTASSDIIASHDHTASHDSVTLHDPPLHDTVTLHSRTASHDTTSSSHGHTLSLLTEQEDYLNSCRHSSMGTVALPYGMAEDEPGAAAIKQLVMLSSNEECLGRIVAHVCLPAFSSQLLQLSQWHCSSAGLLANVAALLYNLLEVGGSKDRKKALDSGLLGVIVKLLQSRDPLPGTCLTLLEGLLIGEDNEDYFPTIVKIPVFPLLKFLEPLESDSGFRGTPTHSSFDGRYSSFSDSKGGRPLKLNVENQHEHATDVSSRTASFNSEVLSEGSSRSAVGPTLTGQLITHLEARSIALKLLALSSSHAKMITQLCNESALALLLDVLLEPSQQDVVNALTTLANVASHVVSHPVLAQLRVCDKLQALGHSGPPVRYQVTRLLVYTGEFTVDEHSGSLFCDSGSGCDGENVVLETGETSYVRGAHVEQLIQMLTSNYLLLWGGVELGSKEKWMVAMGMISEQHLLEDIIIDFFLTTYQSFVEPVIFLRLLIHRIVTAAGEVGMSLYKPISSVELSGLMILTKWLRTFSDDFHQRKILQDEVTALIAQLRKCRGPRLRYAHQLKNLLYDAKLNRRHISDKSFEAANIPHHDHLYPLCQRMIVTGHLPSNEEKAIYMAALQLHIENITTQASPCANGTKSIKSMSSSRIKQALPFTHYKIKQLNKRVTVQLKRVSELSERNAKHTYIEQCMALPGYGATFYDIKVPYVGHLKHRTYTSHLLGVSEGELILLDEAKNVVCRYSIEELLGIYHEPGQCLITLVLKETELKFIMSLPSIAMELCSVLEQYQDNNDWAKMCVEDYFDQADESSWNKYFELSSDNSNESNSSQSSPDLCLEHLLQPLAASNSSHELPHHQSSAASKSSDRLLSFCNCPPDPQFPKHLDHSRMSVKVLLNYPVEMARQITLIDHEFLRNISTREMLQKASVYRQSSNVECAHGTLSTVETGIEQMAVNFNKLGSFVTRVVQQHAMDDRVDIVKGFILVAKNCFELKNFNAVMAIAVIGLQSVALRSLKATWEGVPSMYMDLLRKLVVVMDSRTNYHNYRDILKNTVAPAVPYLGVFLKDLNSISEGNSDYIRGGLINMHKRRQIFVKLMELKMMQSTKYNFKELEHVQHALRCWLNSNAEV